VVSAGVVVVKNLGEILGEFVAGGEEHGAVGASRFGQMGQQRSWPLGRITGTRIHDVAEHRTAVRGWFVAG
jgi:hypothetical protein